MPPNCDEMAIKLMRIIDIASFYNINLITALKTFQSKSDLSERQFQILCYLSIKEKGRDEHTISSISGFMGVGKSTMSIVMSKLIKKGLVSKIYPSESEDKRKIYFVLTKEGKSKVNEIKNMNFTAAKDNYDSMTIKQRQLLKHSAELLADTISPKFENKTKIYYNINSENEFDKMILNSTCFTLGFVKDIYSMVRDEFNINGNKDNLTKKQYFLLICIKKHGCNTVTKLENFTNSSSSAVSIAVSKLVEKGYLYKETPSEGEDGRMCYIKMTEKGVESIAVLVKKVKRIFVKYLENFSDEDLAKINEAFDELLIIIDENKTAVNEFLKQSY